METKSGPPRKPRTLATFFMSLALGGVYAGTASVYLNQHMGWTLSHALAELVFVGLFFGVPIGFACSPLVVMWLSRKNLLAAGAVLLLVVPSTYPLLRRGVEWADYYRIHFLICSTVSIYLLSCKALSMYLPDVVFDPPLCTNCGYDLRGSPSRKCSECGYDELD